jgi:Aspartyl protease
VPRIDVPLTYAIPDGETHAPMVETTVADVATRLIVDTGASDHVLTTELVERTSVRMVPGEDGTDAAGNRLRSWLVGRLDVSIGSNDLALENVQATAGPPPFAAWGIGGFLSPQNLHPSAAIVLDLASGRLAVDDDAPDRVAERLIAAHSRLEPVWLERIPGDATILVRIALDAREPVVTLLDSGARSTSFSASAVPGLIAAGADTSGSALGGEAMTAPVVLGQSLRVGPARLPVDRLFVPPVLPGEIDGLVGMDVLRGTVLLLWADPGRPVLWLVPR